MNIFQIYLFRKHLPVTGKQTFPPIYLFIFKQTYLMKERLRTECWSNEPTVSI